MKDMHGGIIKLPRYFNPKISTHVGLVQKGDDMFYVIYSRVNKPEKKSFLTSEEIKKYEKRGIKFEYHKEEE
jgi:hypothetical protein